MSQIQDSKMLRVDGLSINLANRKARVVDDVSFSIAAGEILGLVGESGSGKTTLALAILGHSRRGLEVESGKVDVAGTSVLSLGKSELIAYRSTIVSYVPQDPATALNPALKVKVQLREGYLDSGFSSERVDALVAEAASGAGLANWWPMLGDRYPHQLSGGQQQRLVIAMAFARTPKLIVLDEPTTGLDVTTQRHILGTIRNLCEATGVAALYVSHDLDVVRSLADRVCVMYSGRIVEQGPGVSLFDDARHPYTIKLLRAVPRIESDQLPHGIPLQPPSPGERPVGCAFAPRCEISLAECREHVPALAFVGDEHSAACVRTRESRVLLKLEEPAEDRQPAGDKGGEVALSVRELSVGYGNQEVLSGVDLDLQPGECVAVVGESGSGKTTLARSIVGLRPWTAGEVMIGDRPLSPSVKDRSKGDVRRVQYVFQNPYSSLNPRKTIERLLDQPIRLLEPRMSRQERSERVDVALQDVALRPEYRTRYPHQLSGGERQRVAIARALITGPSFLICDEVTSSLDVSVQASIVELLDRLRRDRQLGILFITHNLALIGSMAQRVVLLADGSVQESGPVREVLAAPKSSYALKLLEDMPRPRAQVAAGAVLHDQAIHLREPRIQP
jgi:peptide/nickel transport system ATP-binding protein